MVATLHSSSGPYSAGPVRAARWTPATGLEVLGPIPSGFVSSDAVDVAKSTGDVVGTLWVGNTESTRGVGYRWTRSSGMEALLPPASHLDSRALLISPDGGTVLGQFMKPVSGGLESEAFRWTPSQGVVSFGTAPGFERTSPIGMSDDGNVVWGSMDSDWLELTFDAQLALDVYQTRIEKRAFIWTAATGRIDLPHGLSLLSNCDHDYWTQIEDVAADGSVAFGRTRCTEPDSYFEYYMPFTGWVVNQVLGEQREVWIAWDPVAGFRPAKDYLEQRYGLDLTGWQIDSIQIDDVGEGILYGQGRRNGKFEGWVLYVPEPSIGASIAIGIASLAIVRRRRSRSVVPAVTAAGTATSAARAS